MNSISKADELTQTIVQVIREKKPQDVQQLVALVKERLPINEEEILAAILELQRQGTIKLNQPSPAPLYSASYRKPSRALWYWVTIAVAAITIAVVFTVPENLYPWAYLRNAMGIIFVMGLPGYAFIRVLFPANLPMKTSTEHFGAAERVALSIGMSIVLVSIVGLTLNYTPWGIRLTPVALSLFVLTLVFATVAVVREHTLSKKL